MLPRITIEIDMDKGLKPFSVEALTDDCKVTGWYSLPDAMAIIQTIFEECVESYEENKG